MWDCNQKLSENGLTYDVTFTFHNSKFTCEKSIFGSASPLLKHIFEENQDCATLKRSVGIATATCPNTNTLILHIDESPEAFEAVHKFLHDPNAKIDDYLLPSICQLSKKYQFEEVWRVLGSRLAHLVSLENIGEICPLVFLAAGVDTDDPTANALASATRSFLVDNADTIACTQTGQLSARLFIDVTENPRCPDRDVFDITGSLAYQSGFPDDWGLTELVLFYISRLVKYREPLDEGNSASFEEQVARKLTNKIHAPARETVTDEIRMTISDSHLRDFEKTVPPSATSEAGDAFQTQKSHETNSESVTTSEAAANAVASDKETCLLAKTTLGVGSISIHLGKLEGRLVSLSVKRKPIPSASASVVPSSASSSVTGGCNMFPCASSLLTSVVLPPSPPPNAADNQPPNEEASPPSMFHQNCVLRSFGCLPTPLLEPRSAAGACSIVASNTSGGDGEKEGEEEESTHWILVAGGSSQDRCLRTTEFLCLKHSSWDAEWFAGRRGSIMSAISDIESASNPGAGGTVSFTCHPGPSMHSARGRLALTSLDDGLSIYACGGSDGNQDLTSVECLIVDPANPASSDASNQWRFVASLQQARSCSAAASLTARQRAIVIGGQLGGAPLSSVEAYIPDRDEWIYLPPMSEARSQLCAAALNTRNLVFAVGGVSETPNTPCTLPSHSFTFQSCELTELPASGEAYDPRCSHWIRLPELINRSPLIGASLVPISPSSGRLLLIGGSDGHSNMTQTQIFDSRTWTWLLGPSLSIGRVSPCAVALAPTVQTWDASSPCVAVIGGFNIAAGGFLNSVEVLGVTITSTSPGKISPLSIPSSTPPKNPVPTYLHPSCDN
uniref:BTB domain-containing protein n=1 Tax=Mesocestoides corti TaxID=53468 RepID=A0A5K3FF63_MESCO